MTIFYFIVFDGQSSPEQRLRHVIIAKWYTPRTHIPPTKQKKLIKQNPHGLINTY